MRSLNWDHFLLELELSKLRIKKVNRNKVFTTLGASNHVEHERDPHDYYATEPKATKLLLEIVDLDDNVWECAAGGGHMADIIAATGRNVFKSDLISRREDIETINFLTTDKKFDGDIVTNPPYKYAQEFVEKGMELIPVGNKLVMFLKLTFLEGQRRRDLFAKYPPKEVWVSSSRLQCVKGGDFEAYKHRSSAAAYAWFVWEKGFEGDPIIKWFN